MSPVGPTPSVGLNAAPPVNDDARLRKSALQLEGLFVQRMFAAMRDTVPDDGMMAQSSAEGTFTSMLDEKMAEQVPQQWNGEHSLAQALYHQLRERLPAQSAQTAQSAQSAQSAKSSQPTTAAPHSSDR
jgi:peptidoglycan hydrolase FlgJ